jgi:hypothetical protein
VLDDRKTILVRGSNIRLATSSDDVLITLMSS